MPLRMNGRYRLPLSKQSRWLLLGYSRRHVGRRLLLLTKGCWLPPAAADDMLAASCCGLPLRRKGCRLLHCRLPPTT